MTGDGPGTVFGGQDLGLGNKLGWTFMGVVCSGTEYTRCGLQLQPQCVNIVVKPINKKSMTYV